MERDSQPRENPFESGKAHKKAMFHRRCYYPTAAHSQCGKKHVKAHSIRRAADLRVLARAGHVQQITVDMNILMRTGGRPAPALVGVNDASTFTGFCDVHDALAFAPLETRPFLATPEQCFLLFFRAWAREAYTKEAAQRGLSVLRDTDKGRSPETQKEIQEYVSAYAEGYRLGLRDIALYKSELDAALVGNSHSVVESAVVWFAEPLPFACSGSFYPYWSIGGRALQEFTPDTTPDALALTILNENGVGCAVMSWLRTRRAAAAEFAEGILRQPNIADALCRTAYSCLENVYSSPDWWDALDDAQRADLIDRAGDGVLPLKRQSPAFLLPRGAPFLFAKVSRVERVP